MTAVAKIMRMLMDIPNQDEPMMYRRELFAELLVVAGKGKFQGERVLEIGPKDGLDSIRLASLKPRELVLVDLPEKRTRVEGWLDDIQCPHRYVEANVMYMSADEFLALGRYQLIWCTGVLYHNAEQMRFLRKMHQLLEPSGILVLESATLRRPWFLRRGSFVRVYYPQTFKGTGTITHLPTATTIKCWLQMVGFTEIHDSKCHRASDWRLLWQRYACVCRRAAEDDAVGTYYSKSGRNPAYRFGQST
jgi:SAM-dependent methyltransferase|tara:strand:+ start:950 stop:1693 length:744 start_codon:yes stop_codon:yes gene_type:complete